MTQLISYLNFNGNCREAMTFYKECVDGELELMVVGDSPMADKVPEEAKQNIMHSTLSKDGMVLLMASDMMGSKQANGNAITLCLNCSSEEEIYLLFSKLSAGSQVSHPVKREFWGALFGSFTDKFGMNWMLNFG